jgi:hypothetical protein
LDSWIFILLQTYIFWYKLYSSLYIGSMSGQENIFDMFCKKLPVN